MAASGAGLAVLLLEGALRIAGARYDLAPTVQFGWPDPATLQSRYVQDPDLFWVTKDYGEKLDAARRARPQIVFLGDSCTEFGTYPRQTVEHLATRGAVGLTGVALASGGWSSEQGVAQLERDVIPLHPRVVVIYFGWNDHWIALGPSDPDLRLAHQFLRLTEYSRVAQMALKARIGLLARTAEMRLRVPPERYLLNLERMVRLSREASIAAVIVTAPSNHIPGHEPDYLAPRHLRRLADLVPLHQQYVELTRRAARETQATLCDAAAEFAAFGASRDAYFLADGIHFTEAGDEQLAGIVSRCIFAALR